MSEHAGLDEEIRRTVQADVSVRAWVEQLARGGQQREAIAALAQVLPKAAAISWGLETVRRLALPPDGSNGAAALQSVDAWLNDSSDERRRAAGHAAAKAGYGAPAGCVALAVFLSGGSMGPQGGPGPEPLPYLSGRAVAGGISLAVATDPRNAVQHRRVILDEGFRLAEKTGVWKR